MPCVGGVVARRRDRCFSPAVPESSVGDGGVGDRKDEGGRMKDKDEAERRATGLQKCVSKYDLNAFKRPLKDR
jgi:hypothetical protein